MPRRKKETTEAKGKANMSPLALRFTSEQMDGLRRRSSKTGAPVTEIVRQFVEEGLRRPVEKYAA